MSEPATPEWLEMLSTHECLDYLCNERLGRVGFTSRNRPVILPVIYRVEDDAIWFLTEEGTKLSAAVANTYVAFEVDDLTEAGGWSVLVIGQSREEIDLSRIQAMREAGLVAGAPGRRDHLITIPIQQISGRRFTTEARSTITGYL